jgi:hypothetical protein
MASKSPNCSKLILGSLTCFIKACRQLSM